MNGWLILLIVTIVWLLGGALACMFVAGATRKEPK